MENQLTEILIEDLEYTIVAQRGLKERRVRFARECFGSVQHIIAALTQPTNLGGGKVLVGQVPFAHADFAAGGSR